MSRASVLIVARGNLPALAAQLEALVAAEADDAEFVIVADKPTEQVAALVRRLEGDVRAHWTERVLGRRDALSLAARLASHDVCVALGALARPQPGFLAPLVAAVEGGAALAVPVIDQYGTAVHGYDVAEDGSVWPRGADAQGAPGAIAFDCYAAPRVVIRDLGPAVPLEEGLEEVAFTALAARTGPVVVCPGSVVRRESVGPMGSVLVASRNRAEEIGPCVRALVAHGVLAAGGEIVVADNGSTDGTDEVVAELAARHGEAIRLVREERPGASVARNTGARVVRHPVICLIDDDGRPAPGWFEHLRDPFCDPMVGTVGGPVRGLFPAERDPEIPRKGFGGYVSVMDQGDADGVRHPVSQPAYGCNEAFRADVWRAAGGLPEHLGANGVRRYNGEETALEIAIHARGLGTSFWAAGASVGHRIGLDRLQEPYFLLRAYRCGVESPTVWRHGQGRSEAVLRSDVERCLARVFATVELPAEATVDDAYAAIAAARRSFDVRVEAAYALGMVVGSGALLGEDAWRLPDGTALAASEANRNGDVRLPVSAAA